MKTTSKRRENGSGAAAAAVPGPDDGPVLAETNLQGDWLNIFLLLLLYTMQALPMGLSSAVPIILKSKENSSYQELALFSLSHWPFSLKLLWAPLVDAVFIQKLGRRKTWLVPVQYLIGAVLIFAANDIDNLLPERGKVNVVALVYIFFTINFLAATQDIAVDGWALTMLKKNNVGYASTCNSTGQAIGVMLGSVGPVLLTSESFCNKYLRSIPVEGGIVTIKSAFYVLGAFFVVVTTLVAIFKKEKDSTLERDNVELSVFRTYSLLWDILKLPSVRLLAVTLLTSKIGYAASDNVTTLRLIDAGVSKDDIMMISTAMFGINMLIPITIGKYTAGPKAMSVYLKTVPYRLLLNIPFLVLVYYSPKIIPSRGAEDNIPLYYYAILILLLSLQHVFMYVMFVSVMAFFSRISDPRFGGTYMTLLNTIANLANAWTSTVALGMVDFFTVNECSVDSKNHCSTKNLQNVCEENNGTCTTSLDGYYVEMIICTIVGICWYVVFEKVIKNLQKKSSSHWMVNLTNSEQSHSMNEML